MCHEEYTIRRCRWCNAQFGQSYLTHQLRCTYYQNKEWSPRCFGTGGPRKDYVTEWSACARPHCQEQQDGAVARARGDALRAARERQRELEEAHRRQEAQREEARRQEARRRAREREQERERRELERYRNGTLFSGYDEDEEFQAWLRAGRGWRVEVQNVVRFVIKLRTDS